MTDPGWMPIESAPRDGRVIDLWVSGDFARRLPDCFWGKPDHCCGEAGQYCDSEWNSLPNGWVDSTLNEPIGGDDAPTHWQPLPPPPEAGHE